MEHKAEEELKWHKKENRAVSLSNHHLFGWIM